jgi:hypothetical protein
MLTNQYFHLTVTARREFIADRDIGVEMQHTRLPQGAGLPDPCLPA